MQVDIASFPYSDLKKDTDDSNKIMVFPDHKIKVSWPQETLRTASIWTEHFRSTSSAEKHAVPLSTSVGVRPDTGDQTLIFKNLLL